MSKSLATVGALLLLSPWGFNLASGQSQEPLATSENGFLLMTVDSVVVSEANKRLTVSLTLQNKNQKDEFVVCQASGTPSDGRPAVVDDAGNDWRFDELAGITQTRFSAGDMNLRPVDFTRLSAASQVPVLVSFRLSGELQPPQRVDFTMPCTRLEGDVHSAFAIGAISIPVR